MIKQTIDPCSLEGARRGASQCRGLPVRPRQALVRLSCTAGLIVSLGACGFSRTDDQASTIVVPGEVNHEAVHAFEKARGRDPTREELLALHRVWIDNEILYREGLKLALVAGDAANREKVIFSALGVIDEKLRPSSVTEEELRRWFESRRDKYDQPVRFDFEDAALPGQNSETAVRALVGKLNGGAPADARVSLRVFKGRPQWNLVQSYGPETAEALAKAQPGKWLPLRATDGWRAMRLMTMTPATRAGFETQREAIRRDWSDATVAEKRSTAVQALWKKYKIEFDETFECPADE